MEEEEARKQSYEVYRKLNSITVHIASLVSRVCFEIFKAPN